MAANERLKRETVSKRCNKVLTYGLDDKGQLNSKQKKSKRK